MKTFNLKTLGLKTTACIAICIASYTHAYAEVVDGVLEQSGANTALFSVSSGSGDLIGYTFKSNSSVGKSILANCLPGLVCKIGKATTRPMQDPSALKFKDQPSGWIEITQASEVGMVSAITNYAKAVKTRFGALTVGADKTSLRFNGKPVLPEVQGNNSLSIVADFQLSNTDVVLVQNNGGTACAATYHFITISKTGLRATPEFGTCSDIIYPTNDSKTSVTVVMLGIGGRTKAVYRYVDGRLTESVGKAK